MSRPAGFHHTEETKRRMREAHSREGVSWNDGFTKETHPSIRRQSASLMQHYQEYGHPCRGISWGKHSTKTRTLMSLLRRGQQNPNWKGGATEVIRGVRRSPGYWQWRKAVLARDSRTCQHCGTTKNIHAHHLFPCAQYAEVRYDPENGICLCIKCHCKSHQRKIVPQRRTAI